MNSYADLGEDSRSKVSEAVVFLCSLWCPTQPKKLICKETICFVKQEDSLFVTAKGAKPQDWEEAAWLHKMLCKVQLNYTGTKPAEIKPKRFYNLYGSGISSVLVLNFELWCSSASLSPRRVDWSQPQLHLASDALGLEWCSGMRCRHCVKKEAKRWVSTWDFMAWTVPVPLPSTVLGRRLLMRTHESSMITVQVKQIPPIFFPPSQRY